MEIFADVLYFITLALFCALSANHNCTIPMSFRLLWHMHITLKTGELSFAVLHTVLVTASRGHTICSAKKPARLQTADTWPGQSPTCEATDMIYRAKKHPNALGENGMEHEALNKWTELQRVEYFPCKWGTFRHQSKVLGNQWESFQCRSRHFQMGSYLTTTKKFGYDKGIEALWDLGHQDWKMTISLGDHARTVASKNSFSFPQIIITQKCSILLISYPLLAFFGFIAYCSFPALPVLAKPSVFLGEVIWVVQGCFCPWHSKFASKPQASMGPSTNHSAGGNQTTVMPVIKSQLQH